MDAEFEKWWEEEFYPQLAKAPMSGILLRHVNEIKDVEKRTWQAAWLAAKKNSGY